ncbi:hypothetical protein ACIQM4_07760 [Streptomyces sp. NPDC091272]|uniref:hypothetical protein n=1 Tax=Streptomyces sp. NPDC091272 TaxID=3365981 RepID=UPI0037F772E8
MPAPPPGVTHPVPAPPPGVAHPVPAPPPGHAGDRLRRWVTPVNVAVIAFALVAGAGGTWLALRDDGAAPARSTPAPPVPGSTGAPAPGPTSAPTGSAPTPSDGRTAPDTSAGAQVTGPGGVAFSVPSGWSESDNTGASVFYRNPDAPGTDYLQFWPITEQYLGSRELLDITAQSHARSSGFEQISVREVPEAGQAEAMELVYEYDSRQAGERLRAVEWVFRAANGKQYAFLAVGPEADWPRQLGPLATALDQFTAPGGEIP